MPAPYRVIQWATGSVGREALRAVIAHPQLELAGVRVYSDDKDGRDAGELCGAGPTGIRATRSSDALLAAPADCVLYMPRHADLDEVCALLASGKNVIATPFLFYAEAYPEPERSRIASACAQGNSSLHGTGIHPGFIGTVLPLALSGLSRRIDKLTIQERANWTHYDSPRITFDNMRFGRPPGDATLAANPFARWNSQLFAQQIPLLARGLHAELDEVTEHQELVAAQETFEIRGGRIEAGTVCGQRYRWCGVSRGRVRIEIEALWTVGPKYPDAWPKPRDGWTIQIEGEPSLQLHFLSLASFVRRDVPFHEHVHAADVATAMHAVNAVPAVCEAPAGIRSALDLPLTRAGIGFAEADPA
jgi:hypothetical protein